jgi:hypothetical protein
MEPTLPDAIDGYVLRLGEGVLEVHRCATMWTALPAILFGRPEPPKVRVVSGASRGKREVELHGVADVAIQRPKPASSRPWAAHLVSIAGHAVGPTFRFRDERSAQQFAAEVRRQLAVLKQ